MHTILVPIDFSKPSENALKVAAHLAGRTKSHIIILHVIEVTEPLMGTEQYNVDDGNMIFFMQLARRKFTEFLDQNYLEGIQITDLVEVGTPGKGIKHTVEKHGVDLIVMGANGSNDNEKKAIGSNTEKVIRNSDLPILIIKNELVRPNIKKIVFASDFGLEQLPAYQKAKIFARDFYTELQLIYVNTPGENFKSSQEINLKMHDFVTDLDTPYSSENAVVHNDYTVEEGVLNAAHVHSADLIVMPTHGRKGLAHFFSGSIAEDVTNHSNIPVLTFRIIGEGPS